MIYCASKHLVYIWKIALMILAYHVLLFVLYALLYRFKIRYLVRETIHNFSCSTTMPWLRESRFMFCWVLVNSTSTIIYTMLWTYVWNYLIIEYLHQRKRNIDLKWCNIFVISRIYFAPILMKNYLIIQAYYVSSASNIFFILKHNFLCFYTYTI